MFELALDVDRFGDDLPRHRFAAHVAQDVDSADPSGVAGTPTFFVNDRGREGPREPETLNRVIAGTRERAAAFTNITGRRQNVKSLAGSALANV